MENNELQKKMELVEKETGIKQLNLRQRKQAVYSKVTQVIDGQTGNIAETMGTKVYKLHSRVEFLQLYVENLDILYKLEGQDSKVLLFIFQNISFMNTIAINSTLRKNIALGLEISLPTVSRALSRLIDKGIIKPIITDELRKEYQAYTDDMYFIDPNIVGKGSFRELEKLRYTMVKEYNLSKMEVTDTINIEHAYAGFEDINKNIDKHEVVDIKTMQISDKEQETNILISEKKDVDVDDKPNTVQNHQTPSQESLFTNNDLQEPKEEKSEIDKALELENKKLEILQLKLKETNLDIVKKLIEAGRIDEAMEFKRNQ